MSLNGSSKTQQPLLRGHDTWTLGSTHGREGENYLYPGLEGSDFELSVRIHEHNRLNSGTKATELVGESHLFQEHW